MIATVAALMVLQTPNVLSADETAQGWRLLFNGQSLAGWRNFKSDTVRSGWRVQDGVLECADPNNAGDIVSDAKFRWFDLELDYRLAPHSNSGVIFRVGDDGDTAWTTGPEVQLYDAPAGEGVEKSGYLYELYKPTVDTERPGGEWNHLRILVSPARCATYMNGTLYYEYQLGSEDFRARVAKSKFAHMKDFGAISEGRIGLQGDHGVVAFRNVKIRPLP